ncbi:hypothetical protein ACFOOL_06905 [Devosia honganensis]|uniref:Uncharacterized protein n=1 Tax=Devosia honganensis TaxID=1610527 RepID=A0ABV7X149_9HYPH
MTFYGEMQGVASELLTEFGQTGAIRRTVIVPPANNWDEAEEVITDYPVTLAILPMDERRIDGTLILSGDRQALMSRQGLSITPVVGDVLIFNGAFSGNSYTGGEAWTIKKLDTLAPAGVTVMFDAVVRR